MKKSFITSGPADEFSNSINLNKLEPPHLELNPTALRKAKIVFFFFLLPF